MKTAGRVRHYRNVTWDGRNVTGFDVGIPAVPVILIFGKRAQE